MTEPIYIVCKTHLVRSVYSLAVSQLNNLEERTADGCRPTSLISTTCCNFTSCYLVRLHFQSPGHSAKISLNVCVYWILYLCFASIVQ